MAVSILWGKRQWGSVGKFPELDFIRKTARRLNFVGTNGLNSFVEDTYNAKLVIGKYGDINGIRFRSQADMDRFAFDYMPFRLKEFPAW